MSEDRKPAWENDPLVAVGWERDPLVEPGKPALELGGGAAVPSWVHGSSGPGASGFFRLRRRYTVGDEAVYRIVDFDTGAPIRTFSWRVTRVDEDADRVEINDARVVLDTLGNRLSSADRDDSTSARHFTPGELFVGKRWTTAFRIYNGPTVRNVSLDFRITRREMVEVPAGRFNAFRLEGHGAAGAPSFALPSSMYDPVQFEETLWVVPSIIFPVRFDRRSWPAMASMSRMGRNERRELVALKQHVAS